MNTRFILTLSSIIFGAAGVFSLFAPDFLLLSAGLDENSSLLKLFIQLLGAFYCAMAMMNWMAKDSLIGGIYARPVSYCNFVHFLMGVLLLVKYQISEPLNPAVLLALVVYALFAAFFSWLVFISGGTRQNPKNAVQ